MSPSVKLSSLWVRRLDQIRRRRSRSTRQFGSIVGYRSSHRRLLVDISGSNSRGQALELGCVFIPVSRSFKEDLPGLRLAAELAQARDCYLVICCSKRARPADFPRELAADLGDRLVLIDHKAVDPDWRPSLETSQQRASKYHRMNDAGAKRNLALTLATVLEWPSILFLDDDVYPLAEAPTLDRASLNHALSVLWKRPELRVIGWSATDFPDNSVIGHARRLARLRQKIFIGAGAMLVRCDEKISYFPNTYNQDWLFTIAQASASPRPERAIGWAGSIGQLPYYPFRASRARSEETGDVIGEGLLNLFEDHGRGFDSLATASYWEKSLKCRRELILQLQSRIGRLALPNLSGSGERVLLALSAAAKVNETFNAEELAAFVRAWRSDETWWQYHLQILKKQLGTRPKPHRVLQAVRAGKPPSARPGGQAYPAPRIETKKITNQTSGLVQRTPDLSALGMPIGG
jgi:hypothetical protein